MGRGGAGSPDSGSWGFRGEFGGGGRQEQGLEVLPARECLGLQYVQPPHREIHINNSLYPDDPETARAEPWRPQGEQDQPVGLESGSGSATPHLHVLTCGDTSLPVTPTRCQQGLV